MKSGGKIKPSKGFKDIRRFSLVIFVLKDTNDLMVKRKSKLHRVILG